MISHSDFFGDPGAVVQLDPFPFEVRGEDGPSRPSRDSVSRNRNPKRENSHYCSSCSAVPEPPMVQIKEKHNWSKSGTNTTATSTTDTQRARGCMQQKKGQ